MKKPKKIFINLLSLIIFILLLTVGFNVLADYELDVSIPGGPAAGESIALAQYIRYLYLFALGITGIAALGSLVAGGFLYMLSDTVVSKEVAKERITSAIKGLVLALAAYLILYTINPDLVKLKEPDKKFCIRQ